MIDISTPNRNKEAVPRRNYWKGVWNYTEAPKGTNILEAAWIDVVYQDIT